MSESVPTPVADNERVRPAVDQKTVDFIRASLERYLPGSDISVNQTGTVAETTPPREAADQVHPPAA